MNKNKRETVNLLFAVVAVLESRREFAVGHSKRVAGLARLVAEQLGLPKAEVEDISIAALLHDIGYAALPDDLLLKSDGLTDGERDILKSCPQVAVHVLTRSSQLKQVSELIKYHHHRFDGAGVEDDCFGKRLPLGSRIIQVVESFDAMVNPRPYRSKTSIASALNTLETDGAYDPDVVATFLEALGDKLRPLKEEPADLEAFSERLNQVARRAVTRESTTPILSRLAEMFQGVFQDDQADVKEAVEAIEMEPALALKIVSVANSTLYSGVSPVKTVSEALVRIGLNEARDVLITFIYQNLFKASAVVTEIMETWWEQALMRAVAGQALSVRAGIPQPNYAYLLGLLFDIGKPTLLQTFLADWDEGPLDDQHLSHLMDFIDRQHQRVARVLIKDSGLPDDFCRAIWCREELDRSEFPIETLLVNAANDIVGAVVSGEQLDEGAFAEIVSVARLNLSPDDLKAVVKLTVERYKSVRKVLALANRW